MFWSFLNNFLVLTEFGDQSCVFAGELLSPLCVDGMDGAGADEAGAASSSVVDSDDSLPQPTPIPLVETIDEPLGPDIIAGTPGTSSVFQSALVTPPE